MFEKEYAEYNKQYDALNKARKDFISKLETAVTEDVAKINAKHNTQLKAFEIIGGHGGFDLIFTDVEPTKEDEEHHVHTESLVGVWDKEFADDFKQLDEKYAPIFMVSFPEGWRNR